MINQHYEEQLRQHVVSLVQNGGKITYIRKVPSRFLELPSHANREEVDQAYRYLRLFPGLSYQRYIYALQQLGLPETAIRRAYYLYRLRHAPKVGCVVSLPHPDEPRIGWDYVPQGYLSGPGKPPATFYRRLSIFRAANRAIPVSACRELLAASWEVVDLQKYGIQGEPRIPARCIPWVSKVLQKIQAKATQS